MRPSVTELRRGESFILIVDDEPTVLEVTRSMAASLGWHPLLANTSRHALGLFRDHADTIGHVLLDLHMPGMGGAELAIALREIRPDVRIELMTGDEAGAGTLIDSGHADGLLVKPFQVTDLMHALEPHARAA